MEGKQAIVQPHKKCALARMDYAGITPNFVMQPAAPSTSQAQPMTLPSEALTQQAPPMPVDEARHPVGNPLTNMLDQYDFAYSGMLVTFAVTKHDEMMQDVNVMTTGIPPSIAAGIPLQRKRPLSPSILNSDTLTGGTIERATPTTCATLPSVVRPFASGVQQMSLLEQNGPVPFLVQSGSANRLLYSVDTTRAETFGRNCRYIRGRFLKKGASGKVHEAAITERGNFTGDEFVAVKIVDVSEDVVTNTERWNRLKKRLKNILDFRHNHLVAYHTLSILKEPGLVWYELLMDYYSEGDLDTHLKSMRGGNVSSHELNIVCYAMQLADGLDFLHRQHVIHGDLKPQNVLVKRKQGNHCVLAIGDLDEHVQMQRSITTSGDMSKLAGTFWYMSKEMVKKFVECGSEQLKIGRGTDIWSLGCVLIDLVNSRNVDSGRWLVNKITEETKLVANTAASPFPFCNLIASGWVPHAAESVPKVFRECIHSCLEDVSEKRISAANLLRKLQEHFLVITRQSADAVTLLEGCVCLNRFSDLQTVQGELETEPDKLEGEHYRHGCDCHYEMPCTYSSRGTIWTCAARISASGHFPVKRVVTVNGFRFKITRRVQLLEFIDSVLRFDHNHIVFYHKASVSPKGDCQFLTDKLNYGDNLALLLETRRTSKISLSLSDLICFSVQIAAGLNYLHEHQIAHGMLCPTTILLQNKEGRHHLLLLDPVDGWGVADEFHKIADFYFPYQSPELLKSWSETHVANGFRTKADVWSLGCIIAELSSLGVGNFETHWLHNRKTGNRYQAIISASDQALRRKFCQKVFDGFTPYVLHLVPRLLAECIDCCFVANEALRVSANDVRQQLRKVARLVDNALPETVSGLECECLLRTSHDVSFSAAQGERQLAQPNGQPREFVLAFHQHTAGPESTQLLHPAYVHLLDLSSGVVRQMPMRNDLTRWDGFWFFFKANGEDIVYFKGVGLSNLTDAISYRFLDHSWTDIRPKGVTYSWRSESCTAVGNDSIYYWDFAEQRARKSHLKCCSLSSGRIANLPRHDREGHIGYSFAMLASYGKKVICCSTGYEETWVRSFDTATRKWESLPDLPEQSDDYSTLILGHHLYLIGGLPNSFCIV